ncbi:MAG: pyruvoyl-dependent arginine decarboxylase [Candidatus Cloacimonetes bacterium]|nr:pyruvoyl-dependent arginine decarboxylase [Candidatus Cloacimonadota bacterium]MCF7815235.1 pyruvoyl-dependent arginine decarboxylase [Candidatus Cloacimonadota bacterium]MCF7867314.1 pyruvoyl-dependent arginine decarboxylase [Candidatus Cloacimonadota bacterium]MCF7884704.1 pyruvoyl-dependent arginine decarboxylase [Candidatus Cloacimonadota bacterium]
MKGLLIGNRIPREYFITTGTGESDITIHAGSYHLALKDAGIEKANIMTYSSILPGIAQEITRPTNYVHGEVMETIMAACHGESGTRVTAGIIFGWLYNRKTGKKYGGLVCEHNGAYPKQEIEDLLQSSLQELYTNGFDDDYELKDFKIITRSFVPKKKHGTALVALCFTNYIFPILSEEEVVL